MNETFALQIKILQLERELAKAVSDQIEIDNRVIFLRDQIRAKKRELVK